MLDSTIDKQTVENFLSRYRHDLKNKLTPALMMADALVHNQEKNVTYQAQIIVESIEAALELIKKLQLSQ